jgi:hypothetical protein
MNAGPENRLLRLKEPQVRSRSSHASIMALTNTMNISKLRRTVMLSVFGASALVIAGCNTTPEVKPPASPTPAPAASASPISSPATSPSGSPAASGSKVETLVGRWPGVEGTYLNVSKKGDKYTVEIKNLDGTKTFEGTAKGDTIEFTRDGKPETIKVATGAETGMKGFEKETNCVVITKGSEGFCKKS